MDIAAWLRGLGLEQYEPAFRVNEIDERVLPSLTSEDLREIGVVPIGHRRRLLDAIAALGAETPVASSPHAPVRADAERRQLTVMFSDLVGSTPLSSRLDPEDLREVIAAYHRAVADVVRSFDGFVAKYMGDGVLVYFGYPRAHEDDAERAVRAGLGVIDAVGHLAVKSVKLEARVGIATGLVVVGDLIGEGSAQEQSVVGETPNLAARLQALAHSGTLVIAERTRRQIGGLFEIEDLGAASLAGFAEPQRAWRVIGQSGVLSRFEALRSEAVPLVGREEELEVLLRHWQQAKAGEGRAVLLSGEPGIGKSRLTAALSQAIAGEPHTRLPYFCSPYHRNSALYPLVAQLERAAGFARSDTVEERLGKLRGLLARGARSEDEIALLAEALSLPSRAADLNLSAQRKRELLFKAELHQFEALAKRRPVLIVVEDAQWIDPTTCELLDLTLGRVPRMAVLIVITFRPEFQHGWGGQPHVTTLALNRLGAYEGTTLVERLAGDPSPARQTVDEIVKRADGIPLFLEELTKAVLEGGDRDNRTSGALEQNSAIPATLHASLVARLDRLGPMAREVAQIGAVIGREFDYELVEQVVQRPASELREALNQLAETELLFCRGVGPQSKYLFKHALVRDAAYSTLLRGRRQQLHAHVAETLQGQFREIVKAQPALLAHHCTEAGLTEQAIAYLLAAGRQAWRRSAIDEAVALLRRGLALVSALPDGAGRQEAELDLRIALGQALTANRGWGAPELAEIHSRATELASMLNRPRALLLALWGQFMSHFARADLKLARRLAAELLALGDGTGDVLMQVMGSYAIGLACFQLGELTAGRAYLDEGLVLANPAHRSSIGQQLRVSDARIQIRIVSSRLLACFGRLDQALFHSDAALDEARRLSHPQTLAAALTAVWITRWLVRLEPGSLLQYANELLASTTEHGLGLFRAFALVCRGWCLVALGRANEGISLLTAGLAASDELGIVIWRPCILTLLGDAHRIAGQWPAALGHLAEARHLAEETEDRWCQAETTRLSGDVLAATGDRTGAEASYQEAIAIAQQQSAKLWELRAAVSLAYLRRDQGRRTEARDLLAPIYGWFTEGFDTPDLIEARALLDELGGAGWA